MSSRPTPWYKQFWPWFLITIPLVSIILSTTMVTLAVRTKDSVVIDDYYKEGKGINKKLAKYQEAKVRDIQTLLMIDQNRLTLEFVNGQPATGEALELVFHHATLIENDFSVLLTRDAQGVYRATLENVIDGKWKLTLKPIDEQWKILNDVTFPLNQPIPFNP